MPPKKSKSKQKEPCPVGTIRNPETGKCVKLDGAKGKELRTKYRRPTIEIQRRARGMINRMRLKRGDLNENMRKTRRGAVSKIQGSARKMLRRRNSKKRKAASKIQETARQMLSRKGFMTNVNEANQLAMLSEFFGTSSRGLQLERNKDNYYAKKIQKGSRKRLKTKSEAAKKIQRRIRLRESQKAYKELYRMMVQSRESEGRYPIRRGEAPRISKPNSKSKTPTPEPLDPNFLKKVSRKGKAGKRMTTAASIIQDEYRQRLKKKKSKAKKIQKKFRTYLQTRDNIKERKRRQARKRSKEEKDRMRNHFETMMYQQALLENLALGNKVNNIQKDVSIDNQLESKRKGKKKVTKPKTTRRIVSNEASSSTDRVGIRHSRRIQNLREANNWSKEEFNLISEAVGLSLEELFKAKPEKKSVRFGKKKKVQQNQGYIVLDKKNHVIWCPRCLTVGKKIYFPLTNEAKTNNQANKTTYRVPTCRRCGSTFPEMSRTEIENASGINKGQQKGNGNKNNL